MPIDLYPNIAKVKRNGVYQNLPGFVQQSGDADIEAMIANKETNTTAQFAHAKDSFFILNDILYQADENIAVNGTIAVGTNCHVAVLGNNVYELKETLKGIENITIEKTETKTTVTLTWNSQSGFYNRNGTLEAYDGVTSAIVDVSAGEKYLLTGRNYYLASLAVFYSGNSIQTGLIGTVWQSTGTASFEDLEITVPIGAEHMLLQRFYGFTTSLDKVSVKYENALSDDVNDIINATTVPATENITLTFESQTGFYNRQGNIETYGGVDGATVNVTAGEQYFLTSRNYYSAVLVAYFDSSNAFCGYEYIASNANPVVDYEFTVPNGAVKMIVQRVYGYRTILEKVTGIKAKPVKSVLSGKKLTLIGDSITEKNLRAKTNWADYIADWCGATIQNLGASGTGFIAGGANPYSNRIASISNPDIIGVALSFNDMSNTIADLTAVAETFFDNLITAYPSTPIICYVQSPWSAYHYGITASDQWVEALAEICNTRGIPFYDDLYKGCVLKPWNADNRQVYYINDGEGSTGEEDWVHPNSEGHKAIARGLYPLFAKNIVATGLDYLN